MASWISLPWTAWAGAAGLSLLLSIFERRITARFPAVQTRLAVCPVPVMLVLALLFGGAARYQATRLELTPQTLAWYNDQGDFLVRGWVVEPPEVRDTTTRLRLKVESLTPLKDGQPDGEAFTVDGLLLANVPVSSKWRYGDRIELRGPLETPSAGTSFSYREMLARQGIFTSMAVWSMPHLIEHQQGSRLLLAIFDLRQHGYEVINRIFPQPEAALLNGILLGLDQDLPKSLQEAFKVTGTAHIIAISGFNISILAALFAGLFTRLFGRFLTRWWAALAAVLSIAGYTLLVGAEPAVVRAAIMGGLALFGRELGRSSSGFNTLAFCAAAMAFISPDLPWDASFQLSFAATLGLVLYADPLQAGFRKLAERKLPAAQVDRLVGPVGEYFLFTIAAQITTLPVLVYHFKRLSVSALISNPLVLPAQPLVMILAGLALLAGLAWLPLGQVLAYIAWPLAAYTDRAVELLARLPGGSFQLNDVSPLWILLAYGGLFGATLAAKKGKPGAIGKPSVLLAGAGLLAVLAWQAALQRPDERLHLTLFSLDGGMPVLVHTPEGRNLLINTAAAAPLNEQLGRHISPFQRQFDGLLLTREQAGKAWTGLPGQLPRFPMGWAAAPEELWQGRQAEATEKKLVEAGLETLNLEPGSIWDLGQGARLEAVLVTDSGAALLLEWGNFRALLPGGVEPAALRRGLDGRLESISLLVLEEKDLQAGPAAWDWLQPLSTWVGTAQEAGKEAIVWPGAAPVGLNRWAEAVTDGKDLWMQVSQP